jgi:hypothetical protein
MKNDRDEGPGRRWARSVIRDAEERLPAGSDWLAATRSRLDAADEASLRLLREVLSGRVEVSALSEAQFDLFFGLQIFFATRATVAAGSCELRFSGSGTRERRYGLTDTVADTMPREIRAVVRKSEDVFGEWSKARRWLTSHSAILGGTPIVLARSRIGRRLVYDELQRIDHGDYV